MNNLYGKHGKRQPIHHELVGYHTNPINYSSIGEKIKNSSRLSVGIGNREILKKSIPTERGNDYNSSRIPVLQSRKLSSPPNYHLDLSSKFEYSKVIKNYIKCNCLSEKKNNIAQMEKKTVRNDNFVDQVRYNIKENFYAPSSYESEVFSSDTSSTDLPTICQCRIGKERNVKQKVQTDISTFNGRREIIPNGKINLLQYGQKGKKHTDNNHSHNIRQSYESPAATRGEMNLLDKNVFSSIKHRNAYSFKKYKSTSTQYEREPGRNWTRTLQVAVQTDESATTVDGAMQTEEKNVTSQESQTSILTASNVVLIKIKEGRSGKQKIGTKIEKRQMQVEKPRQKTGDTNRAGKSIKLTNNPNEDQSIQDRIMSGTIEGAYQVPKKYRLISRSVPSKTDCQRITKALKSKSAMNNVSGITSRKFVFKGMRPSRYHSSLHPANDDWSTCLKISPLVETKQGDVAENVFNERPEQKVQVQKNTKSSPSSMRIAKSNASCSTESPYGKKEFKNAEEMLPSTDTSSTLSRPMYKRRKLTDPNCDPATYVDLFSKLENILIDGRKKSVENHLKFMNSVSHEIRGDEDNSCVVESTISNVSTGSWMLREKDFSSPGSSNDEMSSATVQKKNRTNRKTKKSKSMNHDPMRMYTSDTSESSEENYSFKPKSEVVLHNRQQHNDRTQTHQNQRKIKELKMSVAVDGLDDMEMIVYYAKNYPTTQRNIQLRHKDIEITKSITTCIDLVKSIIRSVFPQLYDTYDKPSTRIVDVQTKDCQKEQSEDCKSTEDTEEFATNDSTTHITEDQKTKYTEDCATQNTNDSDTEDTNNIDTNNSKKTLNTEGYKTEYNKERARKTTTDSETDGPKDIEPCNNKDHKTEYSSDSPKRNTKHSDTEDTNNSHKTHLTGNHKTEYTNASDTDETNNIERNNNNDSNSHIDKDHKTEYSSDSPERNTKHSDTEDTNNRHKTHLTANHKTEYTNASETDEANNNGSNSHITNKHKTEYPSGCPKESTKHSDTEDTNDYETDNTHKTHTAQNLNTECNDTTASDTDATDNTETISNNGHQTHIDRDSETENLKHCGKEDTKHFNTDNTITDAHTNEKHNSLYTNYSAKQDTNDSDTEDNINNMETYSSHKTHTAENLATEYPVDCAKQNINNNSETEDIQNCDTKGFEPNDAEIGTTVHPNEVTGNTCYPNTTEHELQETLTSPKKVNGTSGNMSPSTCSVVSEPTIYDRCPNIVDMTSSDDSLSKCTTSSTFSGQMSKKSGESNRQTATRPSSQFLQLFKQLEEALGDEQ